MKALFIVLSTFFLKTSMFSLEFITFGTGEINGTYYPTGHNLCKFVNKYSKETNIRCSVESTDGSVYNINAIQTGKFNFVIAQADTIYQATNGIKRFDEKPAKKLRSVMAIYSELFTLITRKDALINSISDLKGKRVNLGNTKSGSEFTTLELFKEYKIQKSDLLSSSSLKIADTEDALIDNKIDAYFFMVGHPTKNIKNAAISLPILIIPILGDEVDQFVKKYSYFSKAIIPAGLYKGVDKPVPTFSVKAVVATSEDTSDEMVYTFIKAILENFETFKKLHPAYKDITKESLLQGLSAPLHNGAKRYFKEVGLL